MVPGDKAFKWEEEFPDVFAAGGQLGELKQKKSELISKLKIRNQHILLIETMESLEISIGKLKERLEGLKENAPSINYFK